MAERTHEDHLRDSYQAAGGGAGLLPTRNRLGDRRSNTQLFEDTPNSPARRTWIFASFKHLSRSICDTFFARAHFFFFCR